MPWTFSGHFLLEIDSLVPLNLIRLENQFQKPQNQFRKLILKSKQTKRKLILKILFLWNHFQYPSLYYSGYFRETEAMGYVHREIYFKELAHMMQSSSESTGQTSRLETQVRDGVAVLSLKSAVLETLGFMLHS